MWLRTFFMVRQWGSEQALTSPLACSRRWHLCAWSNRTSCCWMSLRFSGSAVGPADTPPVPGTIPTEPTCCCSWGCKRMTKFNQVQTRLPFIFLGFLNTNQTGTGANKKARKFLLNQGHLIFCYNFNFALWVQKHNWLNLVEWWHGLAQLNSPDERGPGMMLSMKLECLKIK